MPTRRARDAVLGLIAALLAIGYVVVISLAGQAPPGGDGDRLMALSIRLTELGAPLSFLVLELADLIGAKSPLFPLVYVLLLATILLEWALAGVIVGWVVRRLHAAS